MLFYVIFFLSAILECQSEHFFNNCNTDDVETICCSESFCTPQDTFEEFGRDRCRELCLNQNGTCQYFKWEDDKKERVRRCSLMRRDQCQSFSDQECRPYDCYSASLDTTDSFCSINVVYDKYKLHWYCDGLPTSNNTPDTITCTASHKFVKTFLCIVLL